MGIKSKFYRLRDHYYGTKRLEYVKKHTPEFGLYTGEARKESYIISMASYRGRYNVLPVSIKSLLLQDTKPDRIVIWLDEDTPDNRLTPELEELKQYGVEFRFTTDGIKPHKKYLYAMKEFRNSNIITVDDDLVYSADMLSSLIKYHERYKNCVCARRVHKITFDADGELKPYVEWEYEYRAAKSPSFSLCATGGGGTLYPPDILPDEALDVSLIKKLSLEADDIWLKFMELKNNISVVWVKNRYVMPLEISDSQGQALNSDNVGNGKNDAFINALVREYPETLTILRRAKC